jgi:cyclin-dependent kinase 8/11
MAMTEYKARRDACRPAVLDKYEIIGFISSGTYGRVYKAKSKNK